MNQSTSRFRAMDGEGTCSVASRAALTGRSIAPRPASTGSGMALDGSLAPLTSHRPTHCRATLSELRNRPVWRVLAKFGPAALAVVAIIMGIVAVSRPSPSQSPPLPPAVPYSSMPCACFGRDIPLHPVVNSIKQTVDTRYLGMNGAVMADIHARGIELFNVSLACCESRTAPCPGSYDLFGNPTLCLLPDFIWYTPHDEYVTTSTMRVQRVAQDVTSTYGEKDGGGLDFSYVSASASQERSEVHQRTIMNEEVFT
jgi:hypothetical protein